MRNQLSEEFTEYNEDHVRVAAYYIWEQAGRPEGQAADCWNKAIEQLYSSRNNGNCGCNKKSGKSLNTKTKAKTPAKPKTKAATINTVVSNVLKPKALKAQSLKSPVLKAQPLRVMPIATDSLKSSGFKNVIKAKKA